MIQETIYTVLTTDANFITAAGDRAYPMRIPEGVTTRPACVFQISSNTPVISHDGDSDLDNLSVQCTCWAETYLAAHELAEIVRNAITGSALLFATTQNIIDTQDPETKEYGVIVNFSMWWEVQDIVVEYLLLEISDYLLQETGDKIILEGV